MDPKEFQILYKMSLQVCTNWKGQCQVIKITELNDHKSMAMTQTRALFNHSNTYWSCSIANTLKSWLPLLRSVLKTSSKDKALLLVYPTQTITVLLLQSESVLHSLANRFSYSMCKASLLQCSTLKNNIIKH